MFGPNPSFFQRFGMADPYALGPAWDVESGQDFITFLSSAAYYQDVYGVVGARSRMLRRCDTRAARTAVGERVSSKGTASMALRAPSLMPLGDLEEELMLLAHEPEAELDQAGEEPQVFRRRAAPPAVSTPRTVRPMQRAVMQAASSDEELSLVMHEILSALKSGADYQGLVDRAQRLSVSNRHVRDALRSIQPASRRAIRPSINERFTRGTASPIDVAMTRAPTAGQPRRGLRRVLGASPSVATLEHLTNDLPETLEPVAEAAQRRTSGTVRPPMPSTQRRRSLPIARVLEEARTQQVSGRAGPARAACLTAGNPNCADARAPNGKGRISRLRNTGVAQYL